MSPSNFANEQIGVIRRTFFADAGDTEFYQQRDLLLQAIAFPAAYMKERYGFDQIGRSDEEAHRFYGRILGTVIETIVAKGNRAKIERFSVYFLHCVQQRMKHHGEEYYNLAKTALSPRRVKDALPEVMNGLRTGKPETTTAILIGMHAALKSRGGRKRKALQKSALQVDLFSPQPPKRVRPPAHSN